MQFADYTHKRFMSIRPHPRRRFCIGHGHGDKIGAYAARRLL